MHVSSKEVQNSWLQAFNLGHAGVVGGILSGFFDAIIPLTTQFQTLAIANHLHSSRSGRRGKGWGEKEEIRQAASVLVSKICWESQGSSRGCENNDQDEEL